jgi:hypothetical protein
MGSVDVQTPSDNEEFDTSTDQSMSESSTAPTEAVSTDVAPAESPAPAAFSTPADNTGAPKSAAPNTAKPPTKPSMASKVALPPVNKRTARYGVEGLLVVLVIIFFAWGLSLSSKNKDLTAQNTTLNSTIASYEANPQALVQKQTNDLIAKVGALTTLPTNETPTVAEVSDAAAAQKQSSFFANAQNGDKVLMYAKAGKAILYRPSTNSIILIAPLTFNK